MRKSKSIGIMKVLFLDVDGVLNSREGFLRDKPGTYIYWTDECAKLLASILERHPDVNIVISSTWRIRHMPDILRFFCDYGMDPNRIIGETPRKSRFGEERGHEIQNWLDEHPEVTKFVIVDDDSDMVNLMSHLVQTDGEKGLDGVCAEEIIKRFTEEL